MRLGAVLSGPTLLVIIPLAHKGTTFAILRFQLLTGRALRVSTVAPFCMMFLALSLRLLLRVLGRLGLAHLPVLGDLGLHRLAHVRHRSLPAPPRIARVLAHRPRASHCRQLTAAPQPHRGPVQYRRVSLQSVPGVRALVRRRRARGCAENRRRAANDREAKERDEHDERCCAPREPDINEAWRRPRAPVHVRIRSTNLFPKCFTQS